MVTVTLSYLKREGDVYSVSGRTVNLDIGPLQIGRERWYVVISRGPVTYGLIDPEDPDGTRGRVIYDLIGLNTTVSRRHLTIYRYKDSACIEDLGSRNGTRVYIPNKGLFSLYTPREEEERRKNIPTEQRICIKPGEKAVVVLAPPVTASELEEVIKKFESIVSGDKKKFTPEEIESFLNPNYLGSEKFYLIEVEK